MFTNKFGSIEAIKKNFNVYKYLTGISIESNGLGIRLPLMIGSDDFNGSSLLSKSMKALSESYVKNNPMLSNGSDCEKKTLNQTQPKKLSHVHSNGVSLLDYVFTQHKSLLLSARIDCCSYPLSYGLPKLWTNNLESIMSFLETSLTGIHLFSQII